MVYFVSIIFLLDYPKKYKVLYNNLINGNKYTDKYHINFIYGNFFG